jgi:hypothetical protein
LQNFVSKGGGVLWSIGGNVSFEEYNKTLGPLLPHPLRDMRCEEGASGETAFVGISEVDSQHPIFKGLAPEFFESIKASKTRCYFNLDTGAQANVRTLLRFEHGAPAFIESKTSEEGRVLMFTTSLDQDLTDLPLRNAFPLLMQKTIEYLAKASQSTFPWVYTGSSSSPFSSTTARSYMLTAPDGAQDTYDAQTSTWKAPWKPGVYKTQVLTHAWSQDQSLYQTVNPSWIESDFTEITASQLEKKLQKNEKLESLFGEVGKIEEKESHERGYAQWFLLGLALFLVLEGFLGART